jgi:ComF family protein
MRASLQVLWHRLPALLPTFCLLCMLPGQHMLCAGCKQQCLSTHTARCAQCGHPSVVQSTDYACRFCASHIPAFDTTIVATDYVSPVDRLVISLKFHGQLHLGVLFATLLRDACLREGNAAMHFPDILIATPVSEQRLQERGYNQALEIAKPLGKMLGIPVASKLLIRQRHTRAQSGLTAEERNSNLHQAFIIDDSILSEIAGCHIGVVDDVMTTGQTCNEIATVLKSAGVSRVTNFVFARTLLA